MKRIFLIWFIFSIVTQLFGQTREIIFDQIQKGDGVLHRVFNLYQDHKGFIWFRTAGNPGILRYDGYKFENLLTTSVTILCPGLKTKYYKDLYNEPRFNEIMNRLNLPV